LSLYNYIEQTHQRIENKIEMETKAN